MADPVAWNMIEHGWTVVDDQGKDVGTIQEVVGDTNADIFNGLVVHTGLLATKYVPSEVVGEITEGRVLLLLSKNEIDALDESGP